MNEQTSSYIYLKQLQPCPQLDYTKVDEQLYFPQPGNELPVQPEEQMEPIGPWATGRVTYTSQDGLTGIRPVADRYSITNSGESQWRSNNLKFFKQSNEKINEALRAISNAKRCVERSYKEADKLQLESMEYLKNRASEVHRWKTELEHLILEITKEIELLQAEYRHVKHSLSLLTVPESIAGEFLELRSRRLDSDLIRDEVETELTKEVALCSEIHDLLVRTREHIEMELTELKTAKARMEMDWTDKTDSYTIDAENIKLTNDSRIIMWKLGATRVPAEYIIKINF